MPNIPPACLRLFTCMTALLLSACGAPSANVAAPAVAPAAQPSYQALDALGRALFSEKALSASGLMSCATCHDPAHAYGPPNGLSVQYGGKDGQQAGARAVPSLRYLQSNGPFSEHFRDNDGNDSEDAGPTGGFTWDGRADSLRAQAAIPLLAANEMANATKAELVERLAHSASGALFKQVFGQHAFEDSERAFDQLTLALEVFQQNPTEFYPYSSKYDAVLRGQAELSAREQRGLAVFNDENRGNCASCHISQRTEGGAFPAFTDFGHIAVGVPRNHTLPANRNPAYYDLGLCGPARTDHSDRTDWCGLFRTPTLRNVASRQVFFHNGVFHDLRTALEFYASRDTNPKRWYRKNAAGKTVKFDDLPAAYQDNINQEAPFGGLPGGRPTLSPVSYTHLRAHET